MSNSKSKSNSGASSSSSCSSSRVSMIPNNVRKTIQNIKEITSNHTEDDIYAMLKDCSMDPNETTQRLLHLDSFHEVKKKRDKKKETVRERSGEEPRWKPGHQGRGARNARGNSYSQFNDAGGRRVGAIRKENGVEESREKGFKQSHAPVSKATDSIQPRDPEKSSSIIVDGPLELPNGNLSVNLGVQSSGVGDTHPSNEKADARVDTALCLEPKASAENAPSASDPMLVPTCDSWVAAVGSVKREAQVHQVSAETSTLVSADRGLDTTESVSNMSQQGISNAVNFQISSSTVGNQPFEHVEVADPKISTECPLAEKILFSDNMTVVKSSSAKGVKDATAKLEKLKISTGQHVIIPQHIQVPDAVKNVLSFGSLDASFGIRENGVNGEINEDSSVVVDSAHEDTVGKLNSCEQDTGSTAHNVNHADHPQSPSHLPGKHSSIDTEVSSSGTAPRDDQPKQDSLPAAGPPFPVVQTAPSYNFGFMPPMLANVLVQPEVFDSQAQVSNSAGGGSLPMPTSASTPPPTQSAGAGQSSVAVSPQPIPFFRQPYPHNYVPYSHYFPIYPHPAMHQYFGHAAFPPPLPTGNMYLPPPTAAAGMKISPAHFKPGTNTGNQAPVGMPSGYAAYSTSQVGYNQNATLNSGNSIIGEDLGPPALKENNVYPGQQSEGSPMWLPAAGGRDAASFPLNSFLNLPPQGQHMLNPQSGHGGFAVYHALQPMGSPAPGLPLLQQSQPVAGSVESVGPPSNSYQQPQRQQQINWNM